MWSESEGWKETLAVNLTAALAGVRLAVRAMVAAGTKGEGGAGRVRAVLLYCLCVCMAAAGRQPCAAAG